MDDLETADVNAPLVELSEQQEIAANAVETFLTEYAEGKRNKPFVLSGYAGTGKTYAIKEIIRRAGANPAYMAYTGKAAMVLRRYAHVPATTIHSAIYQPVPPDEAELKKLYAAHDKATGEEKTELAKDIAEASKLTFVRKSREDAFINNDLIVLDECSMVNDELLDDLQYFGIPIIALGDPGQLPPIDGTGALFRGIPDVTLTEIRRQALDNPIITWSMLARNQRTIQLTDTDTVHTDKAAKVLRAMLSPQTFAELCLSHDVIICWRNKTRMELNQYMRIKREFAYNDATYPVPGERLIITKNDREKGIFNGQFCELIKIIESYDTSIKMEVLPEGETPRAIEIDVPRACFNVYQDPEALKRMRPWEFKGKQMADFGYALTCHKAQGSQWEKVMVIDDNVLNWPAKYEERARWLYTAVTRAVDKVTIVVEGRKSR